MNRSVLKIGLKLSCALALAFFLGASTRADDSAAIYKAKCVVCHGVDGKGDTGVGKATGVHDFTSASIQKMTDAQLIEITSKGKNKMPGYADSLKAAQIKDLVAYIRAFKKK